MGGRLAPPGDAAAGTHAVLGLLGDPEGAAAEGTRGRRLVEDALNWADSENRLLDLYRDLLGAQSAEPA